MAKIRSRRVEYSGNRLPYVSAWRDHMLPTPDGCLDVGLDIDVANERITRFIEEEKGRCSNFEYRIRPSRNESSRL